MAAHNFYDDDSVVGFCGGVEILNCFGGSCYGGVETEGVVCFAEIVIDGFWDAYYVDAFFVEFICDS